MSGRPPDYDPDKRPVSSLNFHIGEDKYQLVPEKITAHNVGVMMPLMVAFMSTKSLGHFDFEKYIDEHGLWPCFKKV